MERVLAFMGMPMLQAHAAYPGAYFSGTLGWELFYAGSGTVSGSQLNAINALNNVAGGSDDRLQLNGWSRFHDGCQWYCVFQSGAVFRRYR